MPDQDAPDPKFDAMTARLLQREALRRAAEELDTASGPGLKGVLARISGEITVDAASRHKSVVRKTEPGVSDAFPVRMRPRLE
jgi:hypothetical protein